MRGRWTVPQPVHAWRHIGQDTATAQYCEGPFSNHGKGNHERQCGIQQYDRQFQLHHWPLAAGCQWLACLARHLTVMQVLPSSEAWLGVCCVRVSEARERNSRSRFQSAKSNTQHR